MIKVLLVDDHEMVRIGVSAFLSVQADIEVIGEAGNGKEGVELALSLRPDIILMDLVMEGMNGIEATAAIIKEWPEAKVLIVTSFLDDEKVYPALEAGAVGYMLKTSKANDIANAVRSAHEGQKVLEPEVTDKMMKKLQHQTKRSLHDDLTNRELEILSLMTEGKANKEIAEELFITLKTVKTHVSNILSKLEVQDRTQAVIYAFKHKVVKK